MKYLKRTFVLLLVVISTCLFAGCGEAKTAKAVSNKVERQTQKIVSVLNSLDSAIDSDFEIKDISPISTKSTNTKIQVNQTSLKNQNLNKNLTRENYDYTLTNTAKTSTNRNLSQRKVFIKDNLRYNTSKVNNEVLNDNFVTNYPVKTSEQKVRNYTYTPKYINTTSENFTTDNLQNYFAQIEDLFNTCSDCICSNAECNNCRQNLKIACDNCTSLCQKLKDGSITLTDEQIASCNDCLDRLTECTNKLNSTKGDLNTLLNQLKPLMKNYNSNFWALCECYGKVNECLDTRIDDMNNCISCLDELSNIICPSGNCDNVTNGTSTSIKTTPIRTTNRTNGTKGNSTTNTTTNGLKQNTYRTNRTSTSTNRTTRKSPIKDRIIGAMQSLKNTEKSSKTSAMQTKNNTLQTKSQNASKVLNNNKSNLQNTSPVSPTPIMNDNASKPITPAMNNSNQQAQNAMMNNSGYNGTMNNNIGFNNGMYGYNGMNGYYYGTPRNIDTYANLPKNIDTYQKIYTNIDTYGKDYINNEQQNLENQEQNKVDNQIVENKEQNVPSQDQIVVDNNINKQNTLNNSPLPNPFDPQKVENEKQKELDKESGKQQEIKDDEHIEPIKDEKVNDNSANNNLTTNQNANAKVEEKNNTSNNLPKTLDNHLKEEELNISNAEQQKNAENKTLEKVAKPVQNN